MITGILFFFAILFFATTGAMSNVSWLALFWNAPSFLIVFVPAAVFSITTTSLHTIITGMKALFTQNNQPVESELDKVYISLRVFGDVGFLMGVLGTVIAVVIMGHDQTQIVALGPNISVAILTTGYGLILKVGSYIAEKKLNYRSNRK